MHSLSNSVLHITKLLVLSSYELIIQYNIEERVLKNYEQLVDHLLT
jgi:hypothetical protein